MCHFLTTLLIICCLRVAPIYAAPSNILKSEQTGKASVSVTTVGPWEDVSRPEVAMNLLGVPHSVPKKFSIPLHRSLAFQIYRPNINEKSPVILFSGGWGENFRFYSTILRSLSAKGYLIVNIDHYYYQSTVEHPPDFDAWTQGIRKGIDSLEEKDKQAQFMKTKMEGLKVFSNDIRFTLKSLQQLLKNDPSADLNSIVLMGHSLGGNAGKRVIEDLSNSKEWKGKLKVLVSLDSRLNQLGLKTNFEIPTLVLGAYSGYVKPDPLRQLPKQENLTLKILEHSTHISFDDISIFYVLGKDMTSLKQGLNESTRSTIEKELESFNGSKPVHFGEPLFLGNKEQMIVFLSNINSEIDQFLRRYL